MGRTVCRAAPVRVRLALSLAVLAACLTITAIGALAAELTFPALTGRVVEPILGRDAKLAALIELRESFDLDTIDTLAVGDGANDLAMIGEAGLGVAYHAKPAVAEAAAARIDHGDLTALLYMQGYGRSEFVSS